MNINMIKQFLSDNAIDFDENVDLKKRTWIHRGGIASLFVMPSNVDQLKLLVIFFYKRSIEFKIFGHTSNLYVRNETNIPIVVSTHKCSKYYIENGIIHCEAGTGVIKLANDMVPQGISGFEYLTGLPGTVSAALVNNSSCKKNSISNLLISADVVLNDGSIVEFTPEQFKFTYRTSVFKQNIVKGVIISVRLRANVASPGLLMDIAKHNAEDRKKRLDGNANNLGCTVHRAFSLGKMPLKYYIPAVIIKLWSRILGKSNEYCNDISNKLLCQISGCEKAYPYISKKNVIVYLWLDDGADEAFPVYIKFMETVYRTKDIEIEVI